MEPLTARELQLITAGLALLATTMDELPPYLRICDPEECVALQKKVFGDVGED